LRFPLSQDNSSFPFLIAFYRGEEGEHFHGFSGQIKNTKRLKLCIQHYLLAAADFGEGYHSMEKLIRRKARVTLKLITITRIR
jgi:hypothetical protein